MYHAGEARRAPLHSLEFWPLLPASWSLSSFRSPPTPCLVIGAVLLPAFAALEEVSRGAACLGHLVLTDGLLGHGIPQFPQLITGHFLEKKECALQGQGAPRSPTPHLGFRELEQRKGNILD